jgi:Mg2+ and Co2+ transporter CorA
MLRSDFPFRSHRWPQRLAMFLLGEAFLGFLAIGATALTLFPLLFDVSARADTGIETAQWAIIAWFAVEYAVALAWAPDRRAFLRNPWRWLDLATILVPLATIVPRVSDALRSSPVLRLVRLVRVITMGIRASGAVVRAEARQAAAAGPAAPARVVLLRGGKPGAGSEVSWSEFLRWVKEPGAEWFHVAQPSPADLRGIAAAADIPPELLGPQLAGTGYPHVEKVGPYAGFFVMLPEVGAAGEVSREGVYVLVGEENVLSLSRRATALPSLAGTAAESAEQAALRFPARTTHLFLRTVLSQSERLAGFHQDELHALEEVPVRDSRAEFFERTFRLKKELTAVQADLWRLRALLAELADGRAPLPGMAAADERAVFQRLADDAAFLLETVTTTREEVLSLIELHINVVSFDMNRVMRVLAVVSVLGLIPSVVGGLFGMNLADNPWPFTLPQVAFAIGTSMVLALYFFFVKGWLR